MVFALGLFTSGCLSVNPPTWEPALAVPGASTSLKGKTVVVSDFSLGKLWVEGGGVEAKTVGMVKTENGPMGYRDVYTQVPAGVVYHPGTQMSNGRDISSAIASRLKEDGVSAKAMVGVTPDQLKSDEVLLEHFNKNYSHRRQTNPAHLWR
jgi:hypothetical protein